MKFQKIRTEEEKKNIPNKSKNESGRVYHFAEALMLVDDATSLVWVWRSLRVFATRKLSRVKEKPKISEDVFRLSLAIVRSFWRGKTSLASGEARDDVIYKLLK